MGRGRNNIAIPLHSCALLNGCETKREDVRLTCIGVPQKCLRIVRFTNKPIQVNCVITCTSCESTHLMDFRVEKHCYHDSEQSVVMTHYHSFLMCITLFSQMQKALEAHRKGFEQSHPPIAAIPAEVVCRGRHQHQHQHQRPASPKLETAL